MSAVDTKFYEKKKQRWLYISLWFLVFVVILTWGLLMYERKISNDLGALNQQISKIDTSIANIEADDQVQLYRMYQRNKWFFETLWYRSQVPLFITHLQKNFARYGLQVRGFDYRDASVSVDISTQTNESGYAYQKIIKFLREYAQDEKALFTLEQVDEFSGYDRINYRGTFNLK